MVKKGKRLEEIKFVYNDLSDDLFLEIFIALCYTANIDCEEFPGLGFCHHFEKEVMMKEINGVLAELELNWVSKETCEDGLVDYNLTGIQYELDQNDSVYLFERQLIQECLDSLSKDISTLVDGVDYCVKE